MAVQIKERLPKERVACTLFLPVHPDHVGMKAEESGERTTTFWDHEDDPTNRVRVHRATRIRCNDGQGMKGSRLPDIDGMGHSVPNGKPSTEH